MVDWDRFFEYSTVKVVKIRDARLGLLHYVFMFLILAYVAGYTIIYRQRYLLTEVPVGSVRMSLMAPKSRTPATELPFCINSTIPYAYTKHNCAYWDADLVVYPTAEDKAMLAATRVTMLNETFECELDDYTCHVTSHTTDTIYIPDIERFTLMIDHTVVAPKSGFQRNGAQMSGKLYDQYHQVMNYSEPNTVGEIGKPDIIEIGLLLKAAGIDSLDTLTEDLSKSNDSKRYDGLVMMVFLSYSNQYSYNLYDIRYEYRVTLVKDTEYKVRQPIYTKKYENRFVFNRHGIRIIVLQVGSIGNFDFQTLLINVVSGFGLLAVATFIVDTLATKLLPNKKAYNAYKYQTTVEFNSRAVKGNLVRIQKDDDEAKIYEIVGEKRPLIEQ
eukprot:TRINITY_DN5855_c0_g1_i1.p1 TRINITY_DN5855_c0_g1~~TRINITY_DN5855_c0_g1_i1.p1  ORF type:complete len:385 (-),score=86.56 TRINITY_DN5855_c0_g1_i1:61-1215(-)